MQRPPKVSKVARKRPELAGPKGRDKAGKRTIRISVALFTKGWQSPGQLLAPDYS